MQSSPNQALHFARRSLRKGGDKKGRITGWPELVVTRNRGLASIPAHRDARAAFNFSSVLRLRRGCGMRIAIIPNMAEVLNTGGERRSHESVP